ncbi:MAG: SagB/ThcOx family dehydrogenase [Candidatus Sericytochromatia bacterium]|nr:SagB/ThcOx family dehydrogenase [Candidatus Sericytochromatia bacterium]
MATKSFAEYYHQETKYSPKGLAKNQRQIDPTKQPIPFKEYIKGDTIDLKQYISKKNEDKIYETEADKNLQKLSKLLYYTNGVTALIPYNTPLLLRASPSAGGLYPTEIYIIANNFEGLEDGIYNFQVRNHSLIRFWDKNVWEALKKSCFEHPSFDKSNLSIVLTGIFFRSSWRYEDRAYRRILLDTGHLLGNLILYSTFIDKYATLIGTFNDDKVNDLLWLDKSEEVALAVINFSDQKLEQTDNRVLASSIDKEKHYNNDLILDFHNSTKIDRLIALNTKEEEIKNKFTLAFAETLNLTPINWNNQLEKTIINRRSTRTFSGDAITSKELSQLLSFTYDPSSYEDQGFDPNPDFFDLSIIQTYIAVTDVEGLEDGCYYYSSDKKELKQIRFKNFRAELCYLCLGQELGRDAGVVFFHTINLPKAIEKYGERAYRYTHIDAGNLGQKLNLACMKLGLGVSGIAGFFDDQVNELLGIPETEAVLYITVIGRPVKTQY